MSTSALQSQVDEIGRMAPKLAPLVVPRGYDVQSLSALAQQDGGKGAVEELRGVLTSWAQRTTKCGICDSVGEAAVGREGGAEDADALDELRFTTVWHADFPAKRLTVRHGMFACGRCRLCLDAGGLARLGALAVQPVDAGAEDDAPAAPLAEELVAHVVFANGGMRGPGGEALAGDAGIWVQELVARAYSLRVVASNVLGWRLAGPSGDPLPTASRGRAAALAEELLGAGAAAAPPRKKSKKSGVAGAGRTAPGEELAPRAGASAKTPRKASKKGGGAERPAPGGGAGTPVGKAPRTPGAGKTPGSGGKRATAATPGSSAKKRKSIGNGR